MTQSRPTSALLGSAESPEGPGRGHAIIEPLHPVELLNGENFRAIERFVSTPRHRHLGWHYIVDLVWIFNIVQGWPARARVLDVGGGSGPLQYLLAEMGFSVTNVDLVSPRTPAWVTRRYRAITEESAAYVDSDYVGHLERQAAHWGKVASSASFRFARRIRDSAVGQIACWHYDQWRRSIGVNLPVGQMRFVKGNICNVPEISTGSFDGVVSLSAVEHIPIHLIPSAMQEINRVLRPGGGMAITTSATHMADTWLHEPSRGLCFSASDSCRIFAGEFLPHIGMDEVLRAYQENQYLRSHLARFYFLSDQNGMPNGHWNPTYIPIGVRR